MTTKKIVVLSWAMRALRFLSVGTVVLSVVAACALAVLAMACGEFSPETGREVTACMPAPAMGPYPAVTCPDAGHKDSGRDAHHSD
jgi:hypothetical protein